MSLSKRHQRRRQNRAKKKQRDRNQRNKQIITLHEEEKLSTGQIAKKLNMSSRQVARILSKHRNRHKEEEEEEVRVGYCPQCETIVSLPCVMCRVKLFESHITHRDTVYTDFPLSVEIIGLKPASKLLEKLTLVGIKQVGHILEETVDSLIDHVSLKFFEVEFLLKRLEKLGLNVE